MFRRRASEAKHEATAPDRGRGAGQAGQGGPGAGQGGQGGPGGHGARQDRGQPPAASAAGEEPGRAAAETWGPPPAGLDVSAPHPARVWNYWLGGRDFFAADKAAGEEIGREFPHLAEMARAERAFLVRRSEERRVGKGCRSRWGV